MNQSYAVTLRNILATEFIAAAGGTPLDATSAAARSDPAVADAIDAASIRGAAVAQTYSQAVTTLAN